MDSKLNIILIVIDAARRDHFSCYGYSKNTTPNIDQIAKESVLYESAISTAGWTLPSHTSIFTGTYASKHGVHNENHLFGKKLATMPEVLQKEGYRTVGFCSNDWISDATGLTRGFTEFNNFHYPILIHKAKRFVNRLRIHGKDSWGYAINKKVQHWLNRNASLAPFFMFIHYHELHLPYQIPFPFNSMFLPKGLTYQAAIKVNQDPKAFYAGMVSMSVRDFEISKALYDCALAYQDHLVGQFIAFLQNKKLLDRTILIITSDHGESLGEHGHIDHYYVLYDTLIRVPLIVRYPEIFPAGNRDDAVVQTLDILPTLKEILNLKDPGLKEMQGIPLPPLMNNGQQRTFSISERFQDLKGLKKSYPDRDLSHLEKFERDRKIAIRTKKYKLIASMNYEAELFDIENDPGENTNIIDEKKDIAEQLQRQIDEWRKTFTPAEISGMEAEFEDAIRKRLESLGYLG